jgi:hypothetical protein
MQTFANFPLCFPYQRPLYFPYNSIFFPLRAYLFSLLSYFPYDCREKTSNINEEPRLKAMKNTIVGVPNIYEVNVKGDGKYDCIFPTIVGKRRLRLGKSPLSNIYDT